MKQLIYSFFTLFCICCLFVSCNKDSADYDALIGTWNCIHEEDTMSDGITYTYSNKSDWASDKKTYIAFPYQLNFNSDGTLTGKADLDTPLLKTTFTVKNGYIFNLGVEWAKIVSNNGDTLILELAESVIEINNEILQEGFGGPTYTKAVATYINSKVVF